MRCFPALFLILFVLGSKAQNEVKVSFVPQINNQEVLFGDSGISAPAAETLKVDQLKFYVSHLYFSNNDKVVYEWDKANHLIDFANNPSSASIRLGSKISKFNYIHFQIGIDSLTNVSGALSGDLDPTKGMYWTRQSGYINFKLEGAIIDSTNIANKFEYHLGGYMPPFETLQKFSIGVNDSRELKILIDLEKFIELAKSTGTMKVMSPGVKALQLSIHLKSCFSLND